VRNFVHLVTYIRGDKGISARTGEYYSAGARVAVLGIAAGATLIPVVGWGVSITITVLDIAYGEDFYKFVETKLGD